MPSDLASPALTTCSSMSLVGAPWRPLDLPMVLTIRTDVCNSEFCVPLHRCSGDTMAL